MALVLLPFNNPVFNLALFPASRKLGFALKSLISLLVPIVLSLGAGMLVGWFAPESNFDRLALTTFNAPWWPNLAAVAGSAFFCCLILIRQDRLPRLTGAILSYEIILPFTLAGFGLIVGAPAFWPSALLIALLHLAVALMAATLAFIVIGFAPKTLFGWSLSLVPVVLTLLFLTAATLVTGQIVLPWESKALTPTPTEAVALVEDTDLPTATLAPTETPPIPTATLQPTVTQTVTTAMDCHSLCHAHPGTNCRLWRDRFRKWGHRASRAQHHSSGDLICERWRSGHLDRAVPRREHPLVSGGNGIWRGWLDARIIN